MRSVYPKIGEFEQNQQPDDFHAAAGGAAGRAKKHENDQQQLGKWRPQVKVGGAISGRCNYGYDLK